jgi:catechol 2,3-dioxygenase-like lactoylglutathione lyase family enzyme
VNVGAGLSLLVQLGSHGPAGAGARSAVRAAAVAACCWMGRWLASLVPDYRSVENGVVSAPTTLTLLRLLRRGCVAHKGGLIQGGGGLVAHNRISAVVCSTDLERSRQFYEQKLGLTVSAETIPKHLLFEAGDGTTLLVYGRPSPNGADHTQVRFWCADVAADVRELVERGVEFDLVEFGDFKMVDHVLTTPIGRSAWFKDPDGNTIALFEPA